MIIWMIGLTVIVSMYTFYIAFVYAKNKKRIFILYSRIENMKRFLNLTREETYEYIQMEEELIEDIKAQIIAEVLIKLSKGYNV